MKNEYVIWNVEYVNKEKGCALRSFSVDGKVEILADIS